MTEKELLNLKEDIEQAKVKYSELKGQKKVLMDSLKKKWDCSTITQANKKIDKMKKEIETLEKKKQEGIKELEENYEF